MSPSEPLSTRQLQVLVTLVDLGSFTKAAAHLQLGQSTVSGHIADLERRLGVRLLERDRAGARPTPAGRAILRHARELLRAELHVRQAVAEMSGLLSGLLVLGGSTIPAVYLVPDHVARFRRAHPEIALRLRTGDSREIVDAVSAGDIDVGIVGIQPEGKGLWSQPIDHDQLVLIGARDHPFAARASVSVEEVVREPIVLREPGSGTRAAMLRALGVTDPADQLDVVLEVGSTEAAKAAVRAGLGISFVSSLAVRDEVTAGSLTTVPVEGCELRRSFHLVTRDEDRLSPAARAFREDVVGSLVPG